MGFGILTLKKLSGKQIETNMSKSIFNGNQIFPTGSAPTGVLIPPTSGEELYKQQCNTLSSALLISDYKPFIKIDSHAKINNTAWTIWWPNKGEVIAGSYVTSEVAKAYASIIDYEDIDIYFKSQNDAKEFASKNGMHLALFLPTQTVCTSFTYSGFKFNLIWGINFDSTEDLISRFDIRACSMAVDPSALTLHYVDGSIYDAVHKQIVFNHVPRAVTVRRLTKYIEKDFSIDKYQRLFFAELIRSNLYSQELELTTGYERV